jgi:hypothetical protein
VGRAGTFDWSSSFGSKKSWKAKRGWPFSLAVGWLFGGLSTLLVFETLWRVLVLLFEIQHSSCANVNPVVHACRASGGRSGSKIGSHLNRTGPERTLRSAFGFTEVLNLNGRILCTSDRQEELITVTVDFHAFNKVC